MLVGRNESGIDRPLYFSWKWLAKMERDTSVIVRFTKDEYNRIFPLKKQPTYFSSVLWAYGKKVGGRYSYRSNRKRRHVRVWRLS